MGAKTHFWMTFRGLWRRQGAPVFLQLAERGPRGGVGEGSVCYIYIRTEFENYHLCSTRPEAWRPRRIFLLTYLPTYLPTYLLVQTRPPAQSTRRPSAAGGARHGR